LSPMEDKEFINPIDPDKITETPSILEYAHHVGSAIIKPEDKGKIKGRSLSAMYEQTDQQLLQIREQITLLAKQVQAIELRKSMSEKIYEAKLSFQPIIGNTYHLYRKEDGQYQVSMLSDAEWGRSKPKWEYLSAIKLLGDHTWEISNADVQI
jgi:hypothetical protein